MSLPLSLSILTVSLGFLPSAWLWYARARGRRDWLLTLATAGGVVTFAYAAGPWLFVTYWLRYVALATYGAVAYASYGSRGRLVPAAPPKAPGLNLLLRAVALVTVLALNGLALTAGMAPDGAVEMAFPLPHGTYSVLQGGNSIISNPFHRMSATERFAVDLVKLNPYGARANGLAPAALAAYAVFDDSVMAPCDGTVTEAVDGAADNAPGRANVAMPAGNHIILRCDGTDLLLAHLREGSVTVHPDQRVIPGQLVGRVGNSGNTSEPHLHISASSGGRAVPLTFGGRFLSLNSVYHAGGSRTGRVQ